MKVNDIASAIIEAAIKIHSAIGPGCFERIYEKTLYYELNKKGIAVRRQVMMPIE